MQENALPRILQFVTRKDRHTSCSSSLSSKPLRRESSRRFHVTLSISSVQPPESEPQEQASRVGLDDEREVRTQTSEERLQRPQQVSLGERPESRTPDAADIAPIPPARTPSSQRRASQLSLTQRLDGMFRPVGLPRHELKQTNEVRKGSPLAVIFFLVALLGTASLYIALVASLAPLPHYGHFLFIVALVSEFLFLVKSLKGHATYIKYKRNTAILDAPPPGSIIQGARNWACEPDPVGPSSDLEAAAAVPPAYGIYGGSVRIDDNDISWARPGQMREHRLYSTSAVSQVAGSRPPPYS